MRFDDMTEHSLNVKCSVNRIRTVCRERVNNICKISAVRRHLLARAEDLVVFRRTIRDEQALLRFG